MSSVVFAKALAERVQERCGFNVFHVPQEIEPNQDTYGFIAMTDFIWPTDHARSSQPIGGVIVIYAPAGSAGMMGQQWGYEKLMDLLDLTAADPMSNPPKEASLLEHLNADRTVNGTCTGFLAPSGKITPYVDDDPAYTSGTAWVCTIEFSAYIRVL